MVESRSPLTPDITYLPDTYRFLYKSEEIDVLLDRFREDSDGLMCEATISTSKQPRPGLLHFGRLNLSSARSRADAVRALEKRNTNDFLDADLAGIMEQVCYLSMRRWREGDPSVDLALVVPRTGARYLLYPFLEQNAINLLYGDGGSAKSVTALAMMVSVVTGADILETVPATKRNGLYLDWEADRETHAERLRAICAGASVDLPVGRIHYRRMTATLMESAAYIRREIAEKEIGYVVVDSIGMAGGDEPERAGVKIALFNAARSLGTTFLGVDHVSKADPKKPYGSVYTRNIARLMWAVDKVQKQGDNRVTIALRNEKSNHARLHEPRAYHIDFFNTGGGVDSVLEGVTWTPTDIRVVPELAVATKATGAVLILSILKETGEPMSLEAILERLEALGRKTPRGTVAASLSRHPDLFRVREHLWSAL